MAIEASNFAEAISAGVAAIVGTLAGILVTRWKSRTEKSVEEEYAQRQDRRTYRQQALFELFGPAKMQFLRTQRATVRWKERNDYIEREVVRQGNMAVRDLLLTKGHLIPEDLMPHAGALLEHYDAWLEAYERARGATASGGEGPDFIFVGPSGFPFPKDSEQAFIDKANQLQEELFGLQKTG